MHNAHIFRLKKNAQNELFFILRILSKILGLNSLSKPIYNLEKLHVQIIYPTIRH